MSQPIEQISYPPEAPVRQERRQYQLQERGAPDLEVITYDPPAERRRKGPPLLFVHGAWSSAGVWDVNFLPWFAECGRPGTAFSLQGHGSSGTRKWVRLLRVGDYLEDIHRMVRRYDEPPVLVGLSMGGYLVQKYLENYRAAGGVLIAPVPIHGTGYTTGVMLRDRPFSFLLSVLTFDTRKLVRTHELVRRSCFSADISRDLTWKFFKETEDESVLINLDMGGKALPDPAGVQDPVLVLGAEDDFFFPPAKVRETAQAYGTEARIFPHCAHVIPLENTWREAAEHVEQWVSGL
jgi:hypothetical protein